MTAVDRAKARTRAAPLAGGSAPERPSDVLAWEGFAAARPIPGAKGACYIDLMTLSRTEEGAAALARRADTTNYRKILAGEARAHERVVPVRLAPAEGAMS